MSAESARCAVQLAELQSALDFEKGLAREACDRALAAEGEIRELRSQLSHATSAGPDLLELARRNGEIEALRQRLVQETKEQGRELHDAHERISALEEEIRVGEGIRRKMHNIIQELRGNVRVFARVRPFLPSDGVNTETAVPSVAVHSDGSSLTISKADESHSFSFDKAFPPQISQEDVFSEVSEFVQSALDGYNVCLFSYGQTGSGKTHSMTG